MILANPTPELLRLRKSLRIQWEPYRDWIDQNLERVQALAAAAERGGEESAPILRAQFLHETWGASR